jgi:cytochrome c
MIMRTFSILASVAAAGLLAIAQPVLAQERGTPEDAKALTEKAAAHLRAVGKEQALKDFTAPNKTYVDRDLHVFCQDPEMRITAHGGNPALIGRDMSNFKDPDGKEFNKELHQVAAAGGGFVSYKFSNPATKKIEVKTSYILKEGDQVCGVGAFKP